MRIQNLALLAATALAANASAQTGFTNNTFESQAFLLAAQTVTPKCDPASDLCPAAAASPVWLLTVKPSSLATVGYLYKIQYRLGDKEYSRMGAIARSGEESTSRVEILLGADALISFVSVTELSAGVSSSVGVLQAR